MLSGANTLVLDEPTNHLDIESKEIVEEALMEFEGTLLIVSHDRYLLNTIPDRILELTEHGLVEYKGKFDYYLEKSGISFGRSSAETAGTAGDGKKDELELTRKLVKDSEAERKAKKQSEAEERRRQRRAESVENRIHEIEAEIADIQDEMSLPENAADPAWMHEKASKMAELEEEVTDLYDEWMELQ
jgi:ATP-binding cassette subfamily F protein 3